MFSVVKQLAYSMICRKGINEVKVNPSVAEKVWPNYFRMN